MKIGAGTTLLGALLVTAPGGCLQAECENPDYTQPECRVVVENELARFRTADDLEIRFQTPRASDAESWDATGRLRMDGDRLEARVAGAGGFAISVRRSDTSVTTPVDLRLTNLNPLLRLRVESGGVSSPLGLAGDTVRDVQATFDPDAEDLWIRGELDCPPAYKIAVLGDIQTNPFQFERIVERLQEEAMEDPARPLMGLVVVGDLTELSEDAEFDAVEALFERLPVPVAVTPGNHDVFKSSRAIYNRTFGPGNHRFDVCGTRIVLLDTGNGALAPSVEGRLAELLEDAGSQNLVIGTHYPAYPGLTGNGWSREDQAQHLLLEAVNQRADLLVAGHVHALLDFPDIPVAGETLRQVVVGTGGADQGLGIARYGYLRIDVDASDELHTCFVEVPPPGTGGTNPPLPGLPNCG